MAGVATWMPFAAAVVAGLACGCAFETGGLGSGPGSSIGEAGEATSDDEGSASTGGMGSTEGGGTSTSTTAAPSTTGATTTAGVTTEVGSTSLGDATTDGGQLPPPPYSPCNFGDTMLCWPGEICVDAIEGYNLCSQTGCNGSSDCPIPTSGTAKPHCTGGNNCVLDCGSLSTAMCPDGMHCVYVWEFALWRCAWPNP